MKVPQGGATELADASSIPSRGIGVKEEKSRPCHLWEYEAKRIHEEIRGQIGLVVLKSRRSVSFRSLVSLKCRIYENTASKA